VRDVERGTGIPHGYISLVELGKRLPFKPSNVVKIARFLQIDPYRFFVRAMIEYVVADVRFWLTHAGVSPEGYRLILRRPDGSVAIDIDVASARGPIFPPDEATHDEVNRTLLRELES
jgi:hypothetical protein